MQTKAQRFTTRQRMQGKEFEVFHYRDRKMKNVGVHHHDFYEIYLFLGGSVHFRVQGRIYRLEPGDLLLIGPHALHEAQVDPEAQYERIVLWADRSYLRSLGGEDCDLTACFHTDSHLLRPDKASRAGLQNLMEKLAEEFYSDRPGSRLYAQGLLLQLLVELNRMSVSTPEPDVTDITRQVLAYIDLHYQEPITLQSLAETFYVSRYYLSHEFSARVGTGVYRYILFKRLMYAKERMDGGLSPGQVYQACGFGDYANFYRAFRGEFGLSPREYFKGTDQ